MVLFFFFFKQKTAYEMRISDWSSDVCSSDLRHRVVADGAAAPLKESALDGKPGVVEVQERRHGPHRVAVEKLGVDPVKPHRVAATRIGVALGRSEERRVGNEWVSTCRARWSPIHYKKNEKTKYKINRR